MIDPELDAIVISDKLRTPITVQRKRQGSGIVIRSARSYTPLGDAEIARLVEFVQGAPQLGELQTFSA
ncbi:MAG: hypothetical protein QOE52_2187 [Mycobacterium sp.]|jgi:hypothetical protein|nr:hypothetical protein [Mycobacterium sp.]MDT7770336.1 hypothetical protein [Mycobacterium sp.]